MVGYSYGMTMLKGSSKLTLSRKSWLVIYPMYGDGSKPYPPVVHIKIAGKWMFIPLKMVCIGIDP